MAEEHNDTHWKGLEKDRVSRKVSEIECICQLQNRSQAGIVDENSPDLDELKQKEIQ